MRLINKFIFLLALLTCAVPANATWSIIGVPANAGCSSSSGTAVTIPSTTAGDVLAVGAAQGSSGVITISAVTGCGGAWVIPTGNQIGAGGNGGAMSAYNLSVTAACTSITVSLSSTSGTGRCGVVEFHSSLGASQGTLDTGTPQTRGISGFESNSAAPTFVAAGSNDAQLLYNFFSAISGFACPTGYTVIGTSANGYAFCYRINSTASPGSYTNGSSHYAGGVLAFTEPSNKPYEDDSSITSIFGGAQSSLNVWDNLTTVWMGFVMGLSFCMAKTEKEYSKVRNNFELLTVPIKS